MTKIEFHKYHGNGNDFIIIDNRQNQIPSLSVSTIKNLCHRRFGIGADGLILMNQKKDYDFEMKYYNSDGNESTMCGNGGRCIIKFAQDLGIIKERAKFLAIDGPHEGVIGKNGVIMLKMKDVPSFRKKDDDFVIDTGSPHYIKFALNVGELNVLSEGKKIRYQSEFIKEGINVNFVEEKNGKLNVRTYERGVEDETLSCGTGVVASALAGSLKSNSETGRQDVFLETPGGSFEVTFVKRDDGSFSDIWLVGGAQLVYKGEFSIP